MAADWKEMLAKVRADSAAVVEKLSARGDAGNPILTKAPSLNWDKEVYRGWTIIHGDPKTPGGRYFVAKGLGKSLGRFATLDGARREIDAYMDSGF